MILCSNPDEIILRVQPARASLLLQHTPALWRLLRALYRRLPLAPTLAGVVRIPAEVASRAGHLHLPHLLQRLMFPRPPAEEAVVDDLTDRLSEFLAK